MSSLISFISVETQFVLAFGVVRWVMTQPIEEDEETVHEYEDVLCDQKAENKSKLLPTLSAFKTPTAQEFKSNWRK